MRTFARLSLAVIGGLLASALGGVTHPASAAMPATPMLLAGPGAVLLVAEEKGAKKRPRTPNRQQIQKQIEQYVPGGLPAVVPGGMIDTYLGQAGGYGGIYGGNGLNPGSDLIGHQGNR
jgi:hypothetical protein